VGRFCEDRVLPLALSDYPFTIDWQRPRRCHSSRSIRAVELLGQRVLKQKPKHANTTLPACARWRALFVTVLPLFMRNWRLSPEANGSALDPVMTQPELLLG